MPVFAHGRAEEMSTFVDKYLTEDDKSIIFSKSTCSRVRSIGTENQFLLHSIAEQVKAFIDGGHFLRFIAYGLDYMMLQGASTFTVSADDFEDLDDLIDFSNAYFFEWYQEGSLDDDTIDKAYVWLLTTPYMAMMMTEDVRRELHKTIDCLWLSPATGCNALWNQCYALGKRSTDEAVQHWLDNVQIRYSGCGYNNIIRPQEVDVHPE